MRFRTILSLRGAVVEYRADRDKKIATRVVVHADGAE